MQNLQRSNKPSTRGEINGKGDAAASFQGNLQTQVIRARKPHKARSLRIPGLGRLILTSDPGDAFILSRDIFASEVQAVHRDGDGVLINEYDLGSGLVTNVGVQAMANDFNWAQNGQTLKLANNHATGTGTTSAATSDLALGTLAAPTTTTAVTGTQTFVSNPNSMVYKTVATVNYTSTLAITEWGLHTFSTLSATTGTPLTAVSATSATVTGTPLTASSSTVLGQQQTIIKTGTTASYALTCANTTSKLSFAGDAGATNTANNGTTSWYKTADGTAGTTPGSTEAFTLLPVLWDHKVFAAINVVNGDSIQFSYSLTINSGG